MASTVALRCLSGLRQRGFISAVTHSDDVIAKVLKDRFPVWYERVETSAHMDGDSVESSVHDLPSSHVPAVYAGFDPTADSLHVGNLLLLSALKQFQMAGFRPIVLVSAS